jgi:hypothetical protein
MSVDVEIYMNNIIKFFKDNPKDLLNLVPKDKENEFYQKMKEQASENYEKGEEIPLTQQQIILICVELNQTQLHPTKMTMSELLAEKSKIYEAMMKNSIVDTKFGKTYLN